MQGFINNYGRKFVQAIGVLLICAFCFTGCATSTGQPTQFGKWVDENKKMAVTILGTGIGAAGTAIAGGDSSDYLRNMLIGGGSGFLIGLGWDYISNQQNQMDQQMAMIRQNQAGINAVNTKVEQVRGIVDNQGREIAAFRLSMTGNALFALNSAQLTPQAMQVLDGVAQNMLQNQQTRVVIEGNTCALGDPTHNYNLSVARAQAAASYLISRGVPANRIVGVKGNGEQNATQGPNVPPAVRAQERNIVMTFA
jgi:outer membrane protein OmpA-like peptidoglycan-associated protein